MTVIIFEKDVRMIVKEVERIMSIVVYVVGWNKSLEVTLVGGEYSRPYYNT